MLPADFLATFNQQCSDLQAERDRLEAAERERENAPLALTLPAGETWFVLRQPHPERLARWKASLRKEGATPRTWHLLIAAYDAGWTLSHPAPAAMKTYRGWNRVSVETVETIVSWLASEAAGELSATGMTA